MAAELGVGVDLRPAELHREPRSTVTHTIGPRGQVMPKVTIVTGEPDELIAELVLKACAAIDYDLHRLSLQHAGWSLVDAAT